MSVPVLEAIADAIYLYEGNKARDRAYRNRNPGNLRPTAPDQPQDDAGYRVFPSFVQGYNALLHDLDSKAVGINKSGLNFDSSLEDLFHVYAPAADHNAPDKYALFVADWLRDVYGGAPITAESTFRELYAIAMEDKPNGVPAP
jgi:hypothetical protein